ncbi:MAG: sulfurtransferase-like selenium metabolism protein YedF [Dehalococcoidales bacterium]|nr:sulfurtransferase-like selenium metabolism protein YedF [Dehalococcoidales bacterium]
MIEGNDPTPSLSKEKTTTPHGIVLFITSDVLGRGEDTSLGILLLQKFLHTIPGLITAPETIVLMNNGVKLLAEDSAVLGELKVLESQGVKILACGTCLDRFQLMGKTGAGQVSDMYTLADTIFKAEKVVTL